MGNSVGINNLTICYYNGIDKHKPFILFQKSAEIENTFGTFGIGYCYQDGIGGVR